MFARLYTRCSEFLKLFWNCPSSVKIFQVFFFFLYFWGTNNTYLKAPTNFFLFWKQTIEAQFEKQNQKTKFYYNLINLTKKFLKCFSGLLLPRVLYIRDLIYKCIIYFVSLLTYTDRINTEFTYCKLCKVPTRLNSYMDFSSSLDVFSFSKGLPQQNKEATKYLDGSMLFFNFKETAPILLYFMFTQG